MTIFNNIGGIIIYTSRNKKGYMVSTKNIIIQLQDEIKNTKYTVENLQGLFYKISQDIISNYVLQINNLKIELKELEFYFLDNERHCDPYVHGNDLQKTTNNFLYVHNSWHRRGGIDLTFGNGKYFGGILIRGIKINDKFIQGPANSRNQIIKNLDQHFNNYEELQKYFDQNKDKIGLLKNNNAKENKVILCSTRFGLGAKECDKFKNALYRFIDLDYLDATTDKFENKKSIGEVTKIKTISYLIDVCKNEKFFKSKEATKLNENIKNNEYLQKYISSFKKPNCKKF
jgi:hypothetical protein